MQNETTDTTNAGDYNRMADDLAAIESHDSIATPLRDAARGLIALAGTRCVEIDDALSDSPIAAFEAAHAGLRLCRAALDSIEFSLAEAIIRESSYHRNTLRNIEDTGILAQCEALVAQREE